MSAPKSVVKISKNGVEYTSSVDKASYFIFELTRAALRDVGKFVLKKFNSLYYQKFKKRTGNAAKATKYIVLSSKSTKYPRVEVGLPHSNRAKTVKGFYSYFQEFGTSKTPKLGFLTKAVNENITDIVKIESQYLSALEDEAKALALINESDMEGDADE